MKKYYFYLKIVAGTITAFIVYIAVAILTFPYYWFFELGKGKLWTDYMNEILNI